MTNSGELASTLVGAVVLPVCAALLFGSGAALVRTPLAGAPTAVRLVGAGLATAWLLVVVSLVLLFGSCFHITGMVGGCLAVAGLCRWWCGRGPAGVARLHLPVVAAMPATVIGTLLLVQVARALVLPPLAWDSLTYHLTIPALWIQHGGYCQWWAPDAFGDYSRFPANGELFAAFLMLPFHGDLVVNLFGLPFLLLGGAAVHALAIELGGGTRLALLAAALWMFTPPAFAYATTQYVDIPMAAAALAGWLFVVRFLRTRTTVDGVLAGVGFGLAAGTKHLALVPTAVAGACALWSVVRWRGQAVRGAAGGALAAAAVSLPWYVRSWLEVGNPLYPFEVATLGRVLFAGSALQANVPQLPTPAGSLFSQLWTFQPGLAPITFGPPLVVVAWFGLAGIVRGLAGPSRGLWLALAAGVTCDLLLFRSDGMRILREHWGNASHRFLLVPFGLLLVGMATCLRPGQPRAQRLVWLLGLGALTLDIAAASITTLARDEAVTWVAIALGAGVASVGALHPPRRLKMAIAAGVWLVSLPLLAAFRAATRHDSFAHGFDLQPTARNEITSWIIAALVGKEACPAAVSRGWAAVDDPERPERIAFVAGWAFWGHNWMVYPLLGRRLQNELLYIPATRSGALGTYQPGVPAEPLATAAEWVARVRRSGATALFLAMPPPPELAWAESAPDVFVLRSSGEGFRVFDVR